MTSFEKFGVASSATLPAQPYPGLRPFDPDEHRIFFGREEMINTVIDGLATKNLVVVHGASGSGKSSLVRAGVLPWLAIQQSGSRNWLTGIQRPAGGPLRNLASKLAELLGPLPGCNEATDAVPSWHTRLALGTKVLADVEALLTARGAALCLLVDQFEELFRYARQKSREEVGLLIQLLCTLASETNPAPHLFIVLTMRSDYLGECARFEGFAETVNACQYLLPRLDDFGLLRAVHEPAMLYGGTVDPALGDRLLFAARQEEDALPVLQPSLMRACARARRRHGSGEGWTVTIADLHAVEGSEGSLSKHADEVLAEIQAANPIHLRAAEWLFRSLTELDAEGRVVRRPQNIAELIGVAGGDRASVMAVIEAFRRAGRNFLMTDPSGPLDEATEVDVSHETLIRRWRRLLDPTRDLERNEPVGWVLREFQDGLIWRSLAVQAGNPNAVLDPATTADRWPWYEAVRMHPAWARRYALAPSEGVEKEWAEVAALMERSYARLVDERQQLENEQTRRRDVEEQFHKEQERSTLSTRMRLKVDEQKVLNYLTSRDYRTAEIQLGEMVGYLKDQAGSELAAQRAAHLARHQRVHRVADFYCARRQAFLLAGEEDFERARRECELALRALRWSDDPQC